jgi:hypothetical protein
VKARIDQNTALVEAATKKRVATEVAETDRITQVKRWCILFDSDVSLTIRCSQRHRDGTRRTTTNDGRRRQVGKAMNARDAAALEKERTIINASAGASLSVVAASPFPSRAWFGVVAHEFVFDSLVFCFVHVAIVDIDKSTIDTTIGDDPDAEADEVRARGKREAAQRLADVPLAVRPVDRRSSLGLIVDSFSSSTNTARAGDHRRARPCSSGGGRWCRRQSLFRTYVDSPSVVGRRSFIRVLISALVGSQCHWRRSPSRCRASPSTSNRRLPAASARN